MFLHSPCIPCFFETYLTFYYIEWIDGFVQTNFSNTALNFLFLQIVPIFFRLNLLRKKEAPLEVHIRKDQMIPVGLCYLTELQFAPSLLGAPLPTVLHLQETEGELETETDMEVDVDPSQIPDVLTQVRF